MARALKHYKVRGSAVANTPVKAIGGAGVPAAKAFVGRVVVECDSSAGGTTTIFAGNGVTTADTLARQNMVDTDVFEQMIVLATGEDVQTQVSISNAGGTYTCHLFGEEVDA